ncbi:MAG TPA: hypothetical protein VG711_01655 [Phycisphaerales bacterium]|nr:hypothetical protein [Phycisphaerales bacterium]
MTIGRSESELIRMYLESRTVGCPACNHNLRGATGEACPECGTALRLNLNAGMRGIGPWLTGLLAVALPMGFSLIFGLIGAIGGWRAWKLQGQSTYISPWAPQDWKTVGIFAGEAVVCAILLTWVVRRRGRVMERPRIEQWVRAAGLAVFMAVLQVGVLYLWVEMQM